LSMSGLRVDPDAFYRRIHKFYAAWRVPLLSPHFCPLWRNMWRATDAQLCVVLHHIQMYT
jgi:hypothetical protein